MRPRQGEGGGRTEHVKPEEQNHARRQTGKEAAAKGVIEGRDLELPNVIAEIGGHAADDERGEIERPRSRQPQGQHGSNMRNSPGHGVSARDLATVAER